MKLGKWYSKLYFFKYLLVIVFSIVNSSSFSDELRTGITTHLGKNKTFYKNDKFSLLISLSNRSYSLLIYQMADGKLIQLFPVRDSIVNKLKAGRYYSFSDGTEPYWYTISSPFGIEKIWMFSSNKSLPTFGDSKIKVGRYFQLAFSIDELLNLLRINAGSNNAELSISSVQLESKEKK